MAQHNPVMSMFSVGGGGDSFLSSFLPASFFVSSSNQTQTLWNETTTNEYVRQAVQHGMNTILPTIISTSPFFQFMISFLFHFIFSNHIFTAGVALVIGGKLCTFIYDHIVNLYYLIKNQFVYTLEVKEKENYQFNTVYLCLRAWLSSVDYFENTKYLTVHAKGDATRGYNPRNDNDSEDSISIQLIPGPGLHKFKYKGHWVSIHRMDPSQNSSENKKEDCEKLILSVTSWNGKQILSEIIENAIKVSFQCEKGVTSIYTLTDDYYKDWSKLCDRPNRSLSTIYLEDKVKKDLLDDLDRFLTSEKFYRDNGLNFQRGYLLYGPPGTGKTSLILALAARMQCSVFLLNLSDNRLDDTKLQHLMTKLPRRGIILLEDIDAAFNETRKNSDDSSSKVTFSGLLNAMDGVACQATHFPRIFFMSSNHVEKLDPALIRPGRIDHKIRFDFATKHQISQMIQQFFPDVDDLKTFSEKVADKFPEKQLTTAEVQCYLMRYIYNARECESHVDEYIKEVEEMKLEQQRKKEEELAKQKKDKAADEEEVDIKE